jgi:CRISPR-associated exonuclease Cas4
LSPRRPAGVNVRFLSPDDRRVLLRQSHQAAAREAIAGHDSLASARLGVRGSVDEVFTLADGSMAPFDYKFAEDRGPVFHNQKMQSVLYGLMIRETFQQPVHRGFVCYVRSKHKVVPIEFSDSDITEAESVVPEIPEVIQTGRFPRATSWKARCRDCCYRNICIQ